MRTISGAASRVLFLHNGHIGEFASCLITRETVLRRLYVRVKAPCDDTWHRERVEDDDVPAGRER